MRIRKFFCYVFLGALFFAHQAFSKCEKEEELLQKVKGKCLRLCPIACRESVNPTRDACIAACGSICQINEEAKLSEEQNWIREQVVQDFLNAKKICEGEEPSKTRTWRGLQWQ